MKTSSIARHRVPPSPPFLLLHVLGSCLAASRPRSLATASAHIKSNKKIIRCFRGRWGGPDWLALTAKSRPLDARIEVAKFFPCNQLYRAGATLYSALDIKTCIQCSLSFKMLPGLERTEYKGRSRHIVAKCIDGMHCYVFPAGNCRKSVWQSE